MAGLTFDRSAPMFPSFPQTLEMWEEATTMRQLLVTTPSVKETPP